MDGNPMEFPLLQDDNATLRLQGTFSGIWFCPLNDTKLSKLQVDELRQHISAYRSAGGGVTYLGLKRKRTRPGEFEVDNVAAALSSQNLEDLKKQVEEACKAQCPHCCAKVWDPRELPDNIKQRFDHCFNTYFSTSSHSYFVVRMVVCPSKHNLHLCSEADIGLRIRHGTTSSYYSIDDFVSKMADTSSEVKQELERLTAATTSMNTYTPKVKA